jgi:hypothetical protein
VTSFGRDLRDGLVLGVLISAYWPGEASGQLLSQLHVRPVSARHVRDNQELVIKALQVGDARKYAMEVDMITCRCS